MGVMIIPTVASISEDAMSAVPHGLREGAYALGSTKREVATRVVLPAALSGVAAAFVLAVSRAIGETMIVLIAAGGQPNLAFNPGQAMQTITAFIAAAGQGDQPTGSLGYKTIFAVGLAAVRRDLRDEHRRHPNRAPVPGDLRVTNASAAPPTPVLGRTPLRKRIEEYVFRGLLFVSLAIGLAALIWLFVSTITKGWPRLDSRLWQNYPSSRPERAGARSALFGTVWVVGITALLTVPIGVGAAVYLEEFADGDRWYNRLIEVNIQNLAAVPSIVFGILGLAFIVRGPMDLGPVVLAGALILTLLVLSTVIIASREAIRAVPPSIREGSLALGATQMQTVGKQVLPAAIPGIATGVILALSRAIGEAAPLLLIGALTFVQFTPDGLDSRFSVLPVQIFQWISRPQEEFKTLAAAAIVMLLVLLLTMNALAIFVRNRYQKRW